MFNRMGIDRRARTGSLERSVLIGRLFALPVFLLVNSSGCGRKATGKVTDYDCFMVRDARDVCAGAVVTAAVLDTSF